MRRWFTHRTSITKSNNFFVWKGSVRMKYYIIRIGNNTFYRYGGNTRNKTMATVFYENELNVAEKVIQQYKNAKIEEHQY